MEKIDTTRCLKKKKAILKEYETYLKKKKIKKENTGKIDITRCLKKKKQD